MKKKIVILNIILIIYIISLSVGYAIFSESLTVKGVATTVDFYSGDNLPHTAVLRDLSNNRYHTTTSVPSGITYSEENWNGNTYTLTYEKSADMLLDTEATLDFTISFINPTVLAYTEGLSSVDTVTPALQQTNLSTFNIKPMQLLYGMHDGVVNMLTTNSSEIIDASSTISKTIVNPKETVDVTISIGTKSLTSYGDDTVKSSISYMLQGKRRYFNFIVNLIGTVEPLKLIINTNGGTYSENTNQSMIAGSSITINTPTRVGYIFNGWTVSGEGSSVSGNTFTMGTSDTTITANWLPITYTINYNCNGGKGSTPSSTHTYDVSKTLTSNGCYNIIAGTSGAIYKFAGWATSSTATSPEYSNGQSISNLTQTDGTTINLYAVWSSISIFTYNGSYNVLDDGSGNWRIKLLSSGTYYSNTSTSIDAFLVGGGGGGASSPKYTDTSAKYLGGGGGGAGYTKTQKNISLSATTYTITIGSGGGSNSAGGATSAFGYSASGGKAGSLTTGGAGGSGGGGGGYSFDGPAGQGGQYGNSGSNSVRTSGGAGSTGGATCEFGQGTSSGCNSGVTNYASGGSGGAGRGNSENTGGGVNGYGPSIAGISAGAGAGGGSNSNGAAGGNATANTGSGGGGASFQYGTYGYFFQETYNNVQSYNGGSGGSGIVVIRNKR